MTSVNILGVTIDRKNENGRQNWDRVINKMERLSRYWMMFGLSITGRVFVVKTYLLSQAIYLMNMISMENEHGMRINEIMLNFVKGTDRLIERRRQTLCAELGGYGIVDANVMDLCVKASWVERWKREGRNMDYPALIMWNGDVELRNKHICIANVRNKGMSMMTVIYEAYKNFKREYIDFGNNINTTELFSNSTIMEGDQYMEEVVFGMGRYMELRHRLENKVVGDICNRDGGMVSKEETERVFGVRLNWAEYFRLRVEIERLRVEFVRKVGCPIREISIDEFMLGRKKGIKKYRWIIEGRHSRKYKDNDPSDIAAGITLWGEYRNVMGRELVELNYGMWKNSLLDPAFKNFLFKLVHGKLYLNAQLANFGEVEPQWTFCVIKERATLRRELIREGSNEHTRRLSALDRESVNHLFWECNNVKTVITKFFNDIAQENNLNIDKEKFFGGWNSISVKRTKALLIIVHFVKYYIYICRNRKKMPTVAGLTYEFEGLERNMRRSADWSTNFREGLGSISEILIR